MNKLNTVNDITSALLALWLTSVQQSNTTLISACCIQTAFILIPLILYHVARVQTCLGEADPVKNLFVVKQFSGAFLFHKQHVSTLWEDIHPAE